jgi:hypothetical protein
MVTRHSLGWKYRREYSVVRLWDECTIVPAGAHRGPGEYVCRACLSSPSYGA